MSVFPDVVMPAGSAHHCGIKVENYTVFVFFVSFTVSFETNKQVNYYYYYYYYYIFYTDVCIVILDMIVL